MSLYFVCGKVGAGKSYRGVVSMVDQLLHDDRLIVTNLPVNLAALSEFLVRRYPTHNVCLIDHLRPALPGEEADADGMVFEPSRIRILQEDELAEFYRVRHQAAEKALRIEREKGNRNPVCLDFSQWLKGGKFSGKGVIYHLDELQLFYNVRKFADAPDEFPFYLSQHRKLGDDIYVYTQQPQNVDKMFRSFTQEFIYVVNIGKKRVGPFAAPKIFRFAAYPEPFTGQVGQICQYSGYFRMDYELAATYNTAAGIGIEAAKADVGSKVKGLHWRWLLLLPVLLTVSVFGFRGLGGVWVRSVLPASKKPAAVSGVRPVGNATAPQAAAPTAAIPALLQGVAVENGLPNTGGNNVIIDSDVFMIGWITEGSKMRVALSDGRWVGLEDGLMRVTQTYCVVKGRVYRMRSLDERLRDEERAAQHSSSSWRKNPGEYRTWER
ncbi:MAG TPA: zonular occludens toxin domain-containing protein [Verrucomicrobiae bacterium]|jgi:hypothetical protein